MNPSPQKKGKVDRENLGLQSPTKRMNAYDRVDSEKK